MLVKAFLDKIKAEPNRPLLFTFGDNQIVQGGYHVTEIKNATYDTIDCGNSLHTWREVIVQLWVPAEAAPSDPYMPSGKFLKIWDVVDSRLSLYQDAQIRIEFGDASNLTSNYHVDHIEATEDGIVVEMAPPRTMCKPREILIPFVDKTVDLTAVAGAVASRVEKVMPLAMAQVSSAESSCCAPAPASRSKCC